MKKCSIFRFVRKSNFFKKSAVILLIFSFFTSPFAYAQEVNTSPSEPVQQPEALNTQDATDKPLSELVNENEVTTSESNNEEIGNESTNEDTEKDNLDEEQPQEDSFLNLSLTESGNGGAIGANAYVDKQDGSLAYEYKLEVIPGRNELQPNLSLLYNNQTAEDSNLFGYGWFINIPYIQRLNKKGGDKLYSDHYFYSSQVGELVSTGGSVYRAKFDDGSYLTFELSSTTWTVTDKNGLKYKFGTSTHSQQVDPLDTSKVYKWMLSEIRDRNDNYIKFEYYKHNNQIYPSKIKYTGHGSTDGIFEIDFTTELRNDILSNSTPGFIATTSYRIKELQIKDAGDWVKKYSFNYISGVNGNRSLLSSIIYSGKDETGTVITLPATSFSYSTTSNKGWHTHATEPPGGFLSNGYTTKNVVDVNGDSFPDILYEDTSGSSIYLNNGDGTWTATTTWIFPTGFEYRTTQFKGSTVTDVNGDRLADLLYENSSHEKFVYLNNGSGWTLQASSTWSVPSEDYIFFSSGGYASAIADVNGDGFSDILVRKSTDGTNKIFFNKGDNTGWETSHSPTWYMPGEFTLVTGGTTGYLIGDVNGDKMLDLINQYTSGGINGEVIKNVYINNGSNGWRKEIGWAIPPKIISNGFLGITMADFNGDGLDDLLAEEDSIVSLYVNKGNSTGWEIDTGWSCSDTCHIMSTTDRGYAISDVDGDSVTDVLTHYKIGDNVYLRKALISRSEKPDLLAQVRTDKGGQAVISYKQSALFKSGSNVLNKYLPLNLDLIESIGVSDGVNPQVSTTTYSYEGGLYYYSSASPLDRKFAGFSLITATDPVGNVEKTYYHQGSTTNSTKGEFEDHYSKIGKIFRTEIFNSNGNLFTATINKWENVSLGNNAYFVKLSQMLKLDYDGDSDHKDKAETYVYDSNGNQTSKITWGVVNGNADGTFTDTGSDKLTSTTTFASNSTYNMYLPSKETVVNQSGNRMRETKYYYDNLSHGSVDKGNLTKEEKWRIGLAYIDLEKTYNNYGLVTQEKDPRDKITTFSYDPYNLYKATTTNHKGHVVEKLYDYSSGKVKKVTDANGVVFQTIYDAFDRILEEKQPELTSTSTQVNKTTYVYTDTTNPRKIQRNDSLSSTNSATRYTFLDALDRVVQERVETENVNSFAAKTFEYDKQGLLKYESLPYTTTGTNYTGTTSPVSESLKIRYTYDPLSRPVTISNNLGTTTNAYDQWSTTVTDAEGKLKDLLRDAYGNLTSVVEHNATSSYTTIYAYNGNNSLTKITDALGNIRNFTYDGLGQRLTAEDLHAPADVTFGTWTYDYDNSGNLISIVDPKNQTYTMDIDDLNRVLWEDYSGTAGRELTFTYDNCLLGKTRLCEAVASGSATTTYTYNALGKIATENKKIDNADYATSYTYDRQGNKLEITYPDNSKVRNTYNTAGLLDAVAQKEAAGVYIDLIFGINYEVNGKVKEKYTYNGYQSTYTYDPQKLYRLTKIVTGPRPSPTPSPGPATTTIQNITLTYDKVGNVTQLSDTATVGTGKTIIFTYDDLHRLKTASTTFANSSPYRQTYEYDALGNITNKSDIGDYSYASTYYANPHAATSINGTSLTYDNNGNLTAYGSRAFIYDYRNHLTSTGLSGATTTFAYDHEGTRVKKLFNSVATIYPNDLYNKTGATSTKHVYAGEDLVLTIEGNGSATSTYYTHTDHLGSPQITTNNLSKIIEVTDYFPFGQERVSTGSFVEQRKYIGQEYDEETDLSYLNARYYEGSRGQFLSQDPSFLDIGGLGFEEDYGRTLQMHLMNPQALNSYSYALNNPIRYSDPEGEIVPLLLATWAIAEIGLSVYDGYTAYETLNDPNASKAEKALATGGFIAGLYAPGGGYGAAGKGAVRAISGSAVNYGSRSITTRLSNVNVVSHGKTIYQGNRNLGSVIKNIESGKLDSKTFSNREGLLPNKSAGYYSEYRISTPGHKGTGPERIVRGKGGETYYTSDHYKSFTRLDKKKK